jgi:putative transposase
MILKLIDEAVQAGARQFRACQVLNISTRMVQRWRLPGGSEDKRKGPNTVPKNKLTDEETDEIMKIINNKEFRNLPPSQIVPLLLDRGIYLASEATLYRLLKKAKQDRRHKPRQKRKVKALSANRPLQIWSWDITYLRSTVRGIYYYLYLVVDVYSRKIVGHCVEEAENAENAAEMIEKICLQLGIQPGTVTLHSDNGSPMKGATLICTLENLGVAASFSRPRCSNDNPYSESLFGTMKGRPTYPSRPFRSLEEARTWVEAFVYWYNHVHKHSAIGFVTPEERHTGRDVQILRNRDKVYCDAKKAHPERWSGATRNWDRVEVVELNPGRNKKVKKVEKEVAA